MILTGKHKKRRNILQAFHWAALGLSPFPRLLSFHGFFYSSVFTAYFKWVFLALTWTSIPGNIFLIFSWSYESLLQIIDNMTPESCTKLSNSSLPTHQGRKISSVAELPRDQSKSWFKTILKSLQIDRYLSWFRFLYWRFTKEKIPNKFEIKSSC